MNFIRLFLIIFILSLSGCVQPASDNQFKAVKGYLDLSGWDFAQLGPAPLDGEWEFYQHSLDSSDSPSLLLRNTDRDFFPIPSIWRGNTVQGVPLTAQGQGIYHLRVNLAPESGVESLYISGMLSVCRVWVDGHIVADSGTLGSNIDLEIPRKHLLTPNFPKAGRYVDIVLELSNYHNKEGGINSSILIGTRDQIQDLINYRRISSAIVGGALLIMGLYHLVIFLMRRSSRENLYFSLFCFVWCIATISNPPSAFLLTTLASIDWSWYIKLCLLLSGFTIPLLLIFYHSLFPQKYGNVINWIYGIIGGIYILFIVSTPPCAFSTVSFSYFLITRTAYLYFFAVFFKDLLRGRKGVLFLAPGYIALGFSEFHEILFDLNIVSSVDYALCGVFIFILSYSLYVSVRSAEALSKAEKVSGELKESKITEQNQIVTQIRLSKMLDSVNEAMLAVNCDCKITFCNRAFSTLTGCRAEDIVGQPLIKILSEQNCAEIEKFLRDISQSSTRKDKIFKQGDSQISTASGRDLSTSIVMTPLDLEDDLIYTIVLRSEEKPRNKRQLAAWIMSTSLECWESGTGLSKAELAAQSGLWNVYLEKDGYSRTQTFDRYLSEETLPIRPRWKIIYATTEFVLANIPDRTDLCSDLEKALEQLKKLS